MSSLASTLSFVQQQLIRYVYSTYLIFGITGCCLNIILLTRRQFRTVSCCIYFIMASITMLIALILGVVPFLYSLDHDNPYTTIVSFCKIRAYFVQSNTMMYRWFLSAACFDRYALTSTNARLRNFAQVRVAYRVIAVIIIVWLVLPVQIAVFFNLKGSRCGALNDAGLSLYLSIYVLISGNLLPVSIMVVCAMLIRRNLDLKRQRRRELKNNQENNMEHLERRRDQQAFAMLLLQALVYIATQTPYMAFLFYNAATNYISNKSADRAAIEGFLNFTTEMTVYLLSVSSFYLYTLASRTFRHELMKLLGCSPRRRWMNGTNRINPLPHVVPNRMNIELAHMVRSRFVEKSPSPAPSLL